MNYRNIPLLILHLYLRAIVTYSINYDTRTRTLHIKECTDLSLKRDYFIYYLDATTVVIENCCFISFPKGLHKLKYLREVVYTGNKETVDFSCLQDCEYITSLTITNCNIQGCLIDFSSLELLEELDLSKNQMQEFPDSISLIKNLEILNLSGNLIQKLPDCVRNLYKLKFLKISKNKLTELNYNLAYLQNLKGLNAANNCFFFIPVEISLLSNLEYVVLSHNKITNITLSKKLIFALKAQFLDLYNDTETALCSSIEKYPTRQLTIWECNELLRQKLNNGEEGIHNLTKLLKLDLSHNKLKSIPLNLTNLKTLEILNLGHNFLQYLPTGLKFNSLKLIDLSYNLFTSEPKDFICLNKLTNVHLYNNKFENDCSKYCIRCGSIRNWNNYYISRVLGVYN